MRMQYVVRYRDAKGNTYSQAFHVMEHAIQFWRDLVQSRYPSVELKTQA